MRDWQSENQRLRRVLAVAQQMATTIELDELLRTIVAAACDVLACERATIFLYDAASDELCSRVATGQAEIRFPASRGIAGAAAQQRSCVNVPDAYADPRFNQEIDRRTGFRTRNLLTFALENAGGELMGVLQCLNKRAGAFDGEDEALALALSSQAGVALHRARLLEEYALKQRMARDLDLARHIQQSLFPDKDPCVAGYEVTGWNRPADETGGDFYDFIPLADGRLALSLADATGHGIGAALVMAQARSLLRAMFSVASDLSKIAGGVNSILHHDLQNDRFVTAFVGVLDPRRHVLEYISAGQGPLLHIGPAGVQNRSASALPFAIDDDASGYSVQRFEMPPGGLVVLLTDGFYETLGDGDEQFGETRVIEICQRLIAAPLPELIEALRSAVHAFGGARPQADDLTALLIRRSAR